MSIEISSPFVVLWVGSIAVGVILLFIGAYVATATYSLLTEEWGWEWVKARPTLIGLTLIALSVVSWSVWDSAYVCT